MRGYVVVLAFITTLYTPLVAGCDISLCIKDNQLLIPQSCQQYTTLLQCIKKEYDSCTTDSGKAQIMMGMRYVLKSGVYCGYDMNQLTQMMSAHTGLMTSLWNGTNGMGPMMMGDDGPFDLDDGPLDDGPMDDDGPFDDGPFDDGPFDDMGEHGMFPFLASGGNTGQPDKYPKAPGLIPTFQGGSMMQTNDKKDHDSGAVQNIQSCLLMTMWSVLVLYLANEM